jgi:predicted alpha-1,2-mannosidase
MKFFNYLLFCFVCYIGIKADAQNSIKYVDTRIGTAVSITSTAEKFGKGTEEYGQTLPAVLEPNGMNFWTPQTQDTELKCISPYYYNDSTFQGFRNSHWIVGGCTQDYGSMTLMPLFGTLRCLPLSRANLFSHSDEITTPAYYGIHLKQDDIFAEMTGRSRAAIFRFTYEQNGDGYLVVNPNSDEGEGFIEIDTVRKEIRGYNPVHRIYQGWGNPAGFNGYFVIKFDKELVDYGIFIGEKIFPKHLSIGKEKQIGAYIKFNVKQGERIIVKASSSFTDMEGAEKNMECEIPHWDFDRTHKELDRIWEDRLSIFQINASSQNDKYKFYSAFYRISFLPRTFNDCDGRYPAFSIGTPIFSVASGHNYYDDFSMWDTYRALHPLLNIIEQKKAGDMMQSLVEKFKQGGWLPIFPCWNSYTAAMIGDHCIAALGDAYIKGIKGFDIETAYEAMRKNAFQIASKEDYVDGKGRRALASYLKYGYIPLEDSVKDAFHKREQVSRTLEYAYDDFVLAQIALELGKKEDYSLLSMRSKNYKNVIDPSTGYAQGRHADGRFLKEDNTFEFVPFITEGAPCHYTWYVPQDVNGLIQIMGGKDIFLSKLDSMFIEQRYWHGNEPCHHIPYLFNYAGEPWKTQYYTRHILETEYLRDPGGLSGNDDAGQMSAWYMFSAIGFYPVCPGSPYYAITSPLFRKSEIHLENGKKFTIIAHHVSDKNVYIQSAKLNGRTYIKNYLVHEDIMNGGKLEFWMGSQPNLAWGSSPENFTSQSK